MLVHNPEHIVDHMPPVQGRCWWTGVAEQMARLVASGVCQAWGIATWDPRPLLPILTSGKSAPVPQVVMVRAGLLVPADVLTAADTLLEHLNIAAAGRWGMSPFAGEPELLAHAGISQFLTSHTPTRATAAVALAASWQLSGVSRIAVGASSAQHLDELATAVNAPVDEERLNRYRQRLITRAATR